MKKLAFLMLAMGFCAVSYGQIRIGGRNIDVQKAVQAATDAASAVTLTDEDVAAMSREAVEWMDANNPVLPDDEPIYGARLKRLTAGLDRYEGLNLNFKVYRVPDINAFACADGSIRVFSALMDLMTDDELLGVIGHEIGHVYYGDTKDAMKNAYLTSAVLNAAGAVGGTVGKLSDSQLGELASAFTASQFSKQQEFAADEFGFLFCTANDIDPYAMALSLEKLLELQGDAATASKLQQMFSSHPNTGERAVRVRLMADQVNNQ